MDMPSAISLEEWKAFAEFNGNFDYCEPTRTWIWKKDNDSCLWFIEKNGEIWTKNPSDEFLHLLIALASELPARVRGDEGELYKNTGEAYFEENGKEIPWSVKERERLGRVKEAQHKRRLANAVK